MARMAKNASPEELASRAKKAYEAGRTRFTARIEMRCSRATTEVEECSFAIEAIEGAGWAVEHFSALESAGSDGLAYVLFKRR